MCSNHGSCDTDGNCACDEGYYNINCLNHCTESTCHHRGNCTDRGYCLCFNGFSGDYCENPKTTYQPNSLIFRIVMGSVVFILLVLVAYLIYSLFKRKTKRQYSLLPQGPSDENENEEEQGTGMASALFLEREETPQENDKGEIGVVPTVILDTGSDSE